MSGRRFSDAIENNQSLRRQGSLRMPRLAEILACFQKPQEIPLPKAITTYRLALARASRAGPPFLKWMDKNMLCFKQPICATPQHPSKI